MPNTLRERLCAVPILQQRRELRAQRRDNGNHHHRHVPKRQNCELEKEFFARTPTTQPIGTKPQPTPTPTPEPTPKNTHKEQKETLIYGSPFPHNDRAKLYRQFLQTIEFQVSAQLRVPAHMLHRNSENSPGVDRDPYTRYTQYKRYRERYREG